MSQHSDHAVNAAKAVAGNPSDHSPLARQIAWRTLVAARGGTFRSQTLPSVIHAKSAPAPAPAPGTLQECLNMHSPEVIRKIHAAAARIGIRVPGHTGGDAA